MNSDFNFDDMVERIKLRKKEIGMTNRQLSEMSGVSYGTLNKILGSETKEPSINNIIKISTALGLDAEYVITGQKNNVQLQTKLDVIRNVIEELPDEEINDLLSYVRYLKWRVQERERNR